MIEKVIEKYEKEVKDYQMKLGKNTNKRYMLLWIVFVGILFTNLSKMHVFAMEQKNGQASVESKSDFVFQDSLVKSVKVGFYAVKGYHEINNEGEMSGYGYDFLQLTRKYCNLNYEYVGYDKTWCQMLKMLENGEIDMLTSAHKTKEREEIFDYSLPIGSTAISINTLLQEERFIPNDFSTYEGMKIGMIQGSYSVSELESFARRNGFSYEAFFYENAKELQDALREKRVDALVTSSIRKTQDEKVLSEIDVDYFYVIVKKGNKELLDLINYAILQLNENEGDWKNTLYYENYSRNDYQELTFSKQEQEYIRNHTEGGQKVVIATDNEWRPFSYKTEEGYEGIIPECVDSWMKLAGLSYEFYQSDEDIVNGSVLNKGKADIYFGYSLDDNAAEKEGLVASDVILEASAAFLFRRSSPNIHRLAMCESTPYLNSMFSPENGVEIVMYKNTEEAQEAVLKQEVDAAYLYNYDAQLSVNEDYTGVLAYALCPNNHVKIRAIIPEASDHTLMSIMMKCMNHMPDTEKNSVVAKNISYSANRLSFGDYSRIHPELVAGVGIFICVITSALIIFIGRNHCEKKHRAVLESKIEEIRKLNQSLEENKKSLEEAVEIAKSANKAKSDFLSRMSHDIRTPMNVIVGMTEIAIRHSGERVVVEDCLDKINKQSIHLQTLINDVLDISAIEAGKFEIKKEESPVRDIIQSINLSARSMVLEKSIDYTYEEGKIYYPYINSDYLRITQIYLNLLSNAVKYNESGGKVRFTFWQELNNEAGKVNLCAEIKDTGIGMTQDFMEKMYSEFTRVDDLRVNKILGSGLGLAIVKRITDLMKGSIEVKSTPGVGTCFKVTIPVEYVEKDIVNKPVRFDNLDYNRLKGLRALVVEDNDLNFEIARELLGYYGIEMIRAEDGSIAVETFMASKTGFFDFILMDMQMPVMNGIEATKTIRAMNRADAKTVPIIAMTANAFSDDVAACRNVGMNAHVAKPFKLTNLLDTILDVM